MDGWCWVDDVNLLAQVGKDGGVRQVVDAATFRAKYARGRVAEQWLESDERVDVARTVFLPGTKVPPDVLNAAGNFGCKPVPHGGARLARFFEDVVCGGRRKLARHLLKLLKAALLGRQTKVLLAANEVSGRSFFELAGTRVFGTAHYARVRCYDYLLQPDYPALLAYTPLVVADADVPDPDATDELLQRHRRGENLCKLLGPKLDPGLLVYVDCKEPELVQAHIGLQDVDLGLDRLSDGQVAEMKRLFEDDGEVGGFLQRVLDQSLAGFVPWRVPELEQAADDDDDDDDSDEEEEEEVPEVREVQQALAKRAANPPARVQPDALTCFVRWWCTAYAATLPRQFAPAVRTGSMLEFYKRVRSLCPSAVETDKVSSPQRFGVVLQQRFPGISKFFQRTKKGKVFRVTVPASLQAMTRNLDNRFVFQDKLLQDSQHGLVV